MTTNNALHTVHTTTSTTRSASRARAGRQHHWGRRIVGFLRAAGRFYRVNWQRAAAQEYEYARLREEAVRKYSAASGGRM